MDDIRQKGRKALDHMGKASWAINEVVENMDEAYEILSRIPELSEPFGSLELASSSFFPGKIDSRLTEAEESLETILESNSKDIRRDFEEIVAEELNNVLEHQKIPFSEIGLFGSRATSKAKETSDWDFYAVSPIGKELGEKITELQISVSSTVASKLGLPGPTSIDCLFGEDLSKCIDFKLSTRRPMTGKPIKVRS